MSTRSSSFCLGYYYIFQTQTPIATPQAAQSAYNAHTKFAPMHLSQSSGSCGLLDSVCISTPACLLGARASMQCTIDNEVWMVIVILIVIFRPRLSQLSLCNLETVWNYSQVSPVPNIPGQTWNSFQNPTRSGFKGISNTVLEQYVPWAPSMFHTNPHWYHIQALHSEDPGTNPREHGYRVRVVSTCTVPYHPFALRYPGLLGLCREGMTVTNKSPSWG